MRIGDTDATEPMPHQDILPVILSGGSGTRLWPLSRESFPKQFHPLLGPTSLLQATAARTGQIAGARAPLLICGEETRFLAAAQLQASDIEPSGIILEPVGRNTAPAITVAALQAQQEEGSDPLLLILPSDHVIQDTDAFLHAVEEGSTAAREGWLVTFGIPPQRPATGYGYIEAGEAIGESEGCRTIRAFHEKPDLERARRYVSGGRHLWNAGMFLVRAGRVVDEMALHRPDILEACREALAGSRLDLDFLRLDADAFTRCPSESWDYAVMEPTTRGAVIVAEGLGWSDLGSWESIWEVGTGDSRGNVLQGDVTTLDTRNSYIQGGDRLIAAIGLDDLLVVDTADALLVARKDRSEQVREIVRGLKASGRPETRMHREVHRPWGSYEPIDQGPGYQVKRIRVRPGGRLSLQKHRHRAEHWVVVQGRARVTCDDRVFDLSPNESTYIPLGAVHRLENPFQDPLYLIEVQSGDYLGEDDIIRLEDVYGRTDDPGVDE